MLNHIKFFMCFNLYFVLLFVGVLPLEDIIFLVHDSRQS